MERTQAKTTAKTTENRTKPRIRTQFNPTYQGTDGEQNTQPSCTQPEMSLSIQDLLKNHTNKIGHATMRTPEYFDTEIPIFDDITEEIAYKEKLSQEIKDAEVIANQEIKDIKQQRLTDAKEKKALDLQKAKELLKNEPIPPTQD